MFLKKIDLFGSKLGFTLNNQSNLKSTLGGIFTLFTFIIYILLFNILAKDFYTKSNPKINSEKIFITESDVNNFTIRNDTFLFAISNLKYLEDPKLYKSSLYFVKEDFERHPIQLDFITCDKSYHSDFINYHTHSEHYHCINMKDLINENLTSNYLSNEIHTNYIEFSLKYDNDYINTLNETYKQTLLNLDERIDVLFPELSSPNNYYNPLQIKLDFSDLYLNKDIQYRNLFGFAETKLERDQNFLLDDEFEIRSEIHLANLKEYSYQRFDNSQELIYLRFYLNGLYYNKYTLVYKKLPEALAELMGIMQPLIIVFSFVIEYFTKYNLDIFLIDNFLCYFTKEQNKDDKIIWRHENYKNFKNIYKI